MSTKESLKIFVDAYLLNKEFQGTKTYIQELYKEFSKRNLEVKIYLGCFYSDEIVAQYSQYKNINLLFYKTKNRGMRMLFEIPEIIKKNKFQFAHFQYIIPFKRNNSTKYIVTIHDILFNDFKSYFSISYRLKRNFLFKYSAKKSDFLCTVSSYSKQRIQEVYNIQNKEIFITPNGVNSDYFKEYNKQKEQVYIKEKFSISNYILYVSRIEPRKNQQVLVNAFSKMPKNYSLVFIGEKTLKNKELENELERLDFKTQQRIYFLNNVSDKDLLSFIRAAKAFVYPSIAEGFGIPPLEAAAAKIPVLCSNTTAMSDFKFFAPNHINFEKNTDISLYLEKMLTSISSSKLVEISNQIQKNYSWSVASKMIETIIQK